MTEAPMVPPWAQAYLPAFRELLRTIHLSTGFTLLPVEVSGGDVVHVLADWLRASGLRVAVVAPQGDEAWREAATALAATAGNDAVLLLGERQPPPGATYALRVFNQQRDAIAKRLACSVLWCGPKEFLKLTWERAPDLWSVRALTFALEAPATRVREAPLWPVAQVADPGGLEELMAKALAQGDAANAGRLATMILEALVARGELSAADRLLAKVASVLPASAAIAEAAVLAARGDEEGAARTLARAKGEAPGGELEARRLVAEGNLPLASDAARAEALYAEALAIARRTGSRGVEAIALANLGIAAMGEDLPSSHDHLEEALEIARSTSDDRTEAEVLERIGGAHLAWRDSRRACEWLEDALERFRDLGDARGEAEVLLRLAQAYLDVGDPEKARDDAEHALAIARTAGEADAEREATALLARAREAMA